MLSYIVIFLHPIFLFFILANFYLSLYFLQWKGRNDIAYSYGFPVENLQVGFSPPRPGHPCDYPESNAEVPLQSCPQLLSMEPPVMNQNSVPPSSFDDPVGSSASAIQQIDQLLQKVVDLSRSVPSVDDRISRLAGMFLPEHLPPSDVVKQLTEIDASVLESLRTAVSFVAKGFADLGKKQDLLCKHYEEEAVIKERQFREEEPHKSFDKGAASGLGQRESDAVVNTYVNLFIIICYNMFL